MENCITVFPGAVNLVSLLGTLSQTLYGELDTGQMIRYGERLTV